MVKHGPRRRLGASAVVVALLIVGGLGLARPDGPGPPVQGRPPGGVDGGPSATDPALNWAVADLAVDRDGTALVELKVVVDNPGARSTDSTSILWEPAFAQAFTFTDGEPAPWRVRTDERGWGVLDTSGVLPRRSGTFRLRFASASDPTGTPGSLQAAFRTPRLVVVVDGTQVIAETAGDVRRGAPPPGRWLRVFERGPLARLADVLPAGVAAPHRALGYAGGLAALLVLVAGGGAGAAFVTTNAPVARPDPATVQRRRSPAPPPSPASSPVGRPVRCE